MECKAGRCKTSTPYGIFIVIPSLEMWPTKAKEAPYPHEVRLALLDTNPVFPSQGDCLGGISKSWKCIVFASKNVSKKDFHLQIKSLSKVSNVFIKSRKSISHKCFNIGKNLTKNLLKIYLR